MDYIFTNTHTLLMPIIQYTTMLISWVNFPVPNIRALKKLCIQNLHVLIDVIYQILYIRDMEMEVLGQGHSYLEIARYSKLDVLHNSRVNRLFFFILEAGECWIFNT